LLTTHASVITAIVLLLVADISITPRAQLSLLSTIMATSSTAPYKLQERDGLSTFPFAQITFQGFIGLLIVSNYASSQKLVAA